MNINNRITLKNEVYLSHKTGSVFVLDTNILHRGSWGNSMATRHLLQFEFSNPKIWELDTNVVPVWAKQVAK